MTTSSDNDDDWAELARELERDKPVSANDPPEALFDDGSYTESAADSDDSGADEGDDAADGAAEGEGEPGEDGQPGTGRKRRRRRRRRRKGGQPADGTVAATDSDESEDAEPAEVAAAPVAKRYEEPESEYVDDSEADDEIMVNNQSDADEDAGGELLRDLIANWNVPSWDDVVGGLYRPDR